MALQELLLYSMSQVLRNGFFSDGKFLFLRKEIISQVKNVLLLEKAFLKVNSVSSGKKNNNNQTTKKRNGNF